jgi:uncharacterized protein YbjT (DUF2867 family)
MTALIFGATGMVGIEVLHECLKEDRIDRVVAVVRNGTGVVHHKLTEIRHSDFTDYLPIEYALAEADLCFFCIGVYQGKVPEDEFWEVTVDYQVNLVKAFVQIGADPVFCMFSGAGADRTGKSKMLFARAKGKAEQHLLDSRISRKYIFRPGYIHPGRKKAKPRIPSWLVTPFYKLMPGIGIDAPDLARVMVRVALDGSGVDTLENKDLRRLAGGL